MRLLPTVILILFHLHLSGQHHIGNSYHTFTDSSGAIIECEVYYPAQNSGPNAPIVQDQFPLVVFGNSFQIPISHYQFIVDSLVPRGYILAMHDNGFSFFNSSTLEFGEDIAFLVDTLLAQNSDVSSFFFNSMTESAAAMGHGLGANAAILAATINSNISTIIPLGPSLGGDPISGFTVSNPSIVYLASLIAIPTLLMGSTNGQLQCMSQPPAEDPLPIYNALNSSYKTYLEIIDGSFCGYSSYSGLICSALCSSGTEISAAEQQDIILDLSGKWLGYFLKGECSAFDEFEDCVSSSSDVSYITEGEEGCTCEDFLEVSGIIETESYPAKFGILSDGMILAPVDVTFLAGDSITLDPFFQVGLGAMFEAKIEDCP